MDAAGVNVTPVGSSTSDAQLDSFSAMFEREEGLGLGLGLEEDEDIEDTLATPEQKETQQQRNRIEVIASVILEKQIPEVLQRTLREWIQTEMTTGNVSQMANLYPKVITELLLNYVSLISPSFQGELAKCVYYHTAFYKKFIGRVQHFVEQFNVSIQEEMEGCFSGLSLEDEIELIRIVLKEDRIMASWVIPACEKLMVDWKRQKKMKVDEEIAKITDKLARQYINRMEEVVKKNPGGLAAEALQKNHEDVTNELKNLLKIEVGKLCAEEPIESYWNCLKTRIDKQWLEVVKKNTKKLENKVGRAKRTTATGKVSGSIRVSKQLPPLAFHLTPDRVRMGILLNGKAQIMCNARGESDTPSLVGLTKERVLIYGTNVINRLDAPGSDALVKYWRLGEYFKSHGCDYEENITLKNGSHQITFEFFLGFLLKKLKKSVEIGLEGICSTTVIAVPFWFPSVMRIRVKDAGRIAGFSEVHLVNDMSAAAFACCSVSHSPTSVKRVLVMCKNSFHFAAVEYAYDEIQHTLNMESDYSYETPAAEEKFISSSSDNFEPVYQTVVRNVCIDALKQSVDSSMPDQTIILCEEDEWRDVLEKVGSELADEVIVDEIVVVGTALLSKKPNEIGIRIKDKLGYDVLCKEIEHPLRKRSCRPIHGILISKSDLLPDTTKECFTTLPHSPKSFKVRFHQMVMGCQSVIGELEIIGGKGKRKHKDCFVTNFNLSSEGIVTLKNMTAMYESQLDAPSFYIPYNGFRWVTHNLTNTRVIELGVLLESMESLESFHVTKSQLKSMMP